VTRAAGDRPLDFTSSLFLGLRHPSAGLPSWASLTTGAPAALGEAPGALAVGRAVARSQGAGAGVVSRSTLHALTDVMGALVRPGDVVAVDEAAYPIAAWATRLAATEGVAVCSYPHHRPRRLAVPAGRRLVLVTDGWCPGCNRPAPLAELRRLAARGGGLLVVDDSLAHGVLGARGVGGPAGKLFGDPFGDGSGSLRWSGVGHGGVVWVASMAKAYGAPLAVATGDRATIGRLARYGGNRVHSSPPSAADLAAAAVALGAPDGHRARRARLHARVTQLRGRLRAAGLLVNGLPFPLVSVWLPDAGLARAWWARLAGRGVQTVVQRPRCRGGALLSLLVRADHAERDIDRVADELQALAARPVSSASWRRPVLA
jgi:8-amino-7-oxononanoate synthase